MSIERLDGELGVVCDHCGDELLESDVFDDHVTGDFQEFVDALKEDGWKILPDGVGGWMHACPDCA